MTLQDASQTFSVAIVRPRRTGNPLQSAGSSFAVLAPVREPRYRFTDEVRASTRAIALRMIHAREVAESASELHKWIMRTADLRDTLTKAGYGSAFTSDDLFPLFRSFVDRASPSPVTRSAGGVRTRRWIGIIITAAIAIVVFAVIVVLR